MSKNEKSLYFFRVMKKIPPQRKIKKKKDLPKMLKSSKIKSLPPVYTVRRNPRRGENKTFHMFTQSEGTPEEVKIKNLPPVYTVRRNPRRGENKKPSTCLHSQKEPPKR